MSNKKAVYEQIADSSLLLNPFEQNEKGIDLIEEIDNSDSFPIHFNNRKAKLPHNAKQTKKDVNPFDSVDFQHDIILPSPATIVEDTMKQPLMLYEGKQIHQKNTNWHFGVISFSILLLAFSKAFDSRRFNQFVKAILSTRFFKQVIREEKLFYNRTSIFLSTIHLLTLSLFIYNILVYFNSLVHKETAFIQYIYILFVLIGVYFIKYSSSFILTYVFNISEKNSEYLFTISLFNNLLGVLLIPILIIMLYADIDTISTITYIGIPIITLVYIIRFFRIFQIGIDLNVSYIYIFLYLCTLEILPLVVCYSVLIR